MHLHSRVFFLAAAALAGFAIYKHYAPMVAAAPHSESGMRRYLTGPGGLMDNLHGRHDSNNNGGSGNAGGIGRAGNSGGGDGFNGGIGKVGNPNDGSEGFGGGIGKVGNPYAPQNDGYQSNPPR